MVTPPTALLLALVGGPDAGGNVRVETLDYATDGVLESTRVYTYDADGRRLTARDTAPSGQDPEYYVLQAWAYDANGNIVSYVWEGHGMSDVTHVMRYDVRGRGVK